MKDWTGKLGYALLFCLIQIVLVKFGKFAFGGLIFLFGIIGGLLVLMGHKKLGWGMVIGTLLFGGFIAAFGYLFMEGWVSAADYWSGKR